MLDKNMCFFIFLIGEFEGKKIPPPTDVGHPGSAKSSLNISSTPQNLYSKLWNPGTTFPKYPTFPHHNQIVWGEVRVPELFGWLESAHTTAQN
jgi:hypothetical protein